MMSSKKFIVAKDGKCDFTSLQDAIEGASEGDEIFVKGGSYNESLFIEKAVNIIGDKNDIPKFYTNNGTVSTISGAASFNFIHFSNNNENNAEEYDYEEKCMVEVSANAVFNNCEFSGSFGNCIEIYGEKVKAEFYNCYVHDGLLNGFFLQEECTAIIKDCKIHNIGSCGITIKDSNPKIENCEIYDCYTPDKVNIGILLSGNSSGSYINCKIHDIQGHGIYVTENSTPVIEECEIFNCKNSDRICVGLFVSGNSSGYYTNCKIYNIQEHGIEVTRDSCPIIEDCEIFNCKKTGATGCGLLLFDNTKGKYINCEIHEMEGYGIFVSGNSCPTIDNCKVYDCQNGEDFVSIGLVLSDNSSGSYTNCKIYNIKGEGIKVQSETTPTIRNCEIYSCQDGDGFEGKGIDSSDNSSGFYINCKIHDIQGYGIYVQDEAFPTVEDCEIFNCQYEDKLAGIGMSISGNSSGFYINCKLHDICGYGIAVQDEASPTVEDCEIYNCQGTYDVTGAGMILCDNCTGVYKNCKIHEIQSYGIGITGDSSPIIENCEIYACCDKDGFDGSGIVFYGNCTGTYRNCKIHQIQKFGILVKDTSSPTIEKFEIYNCQNGDDVIGVGMALFDDSTGSYTNCKIHSIRGYGIEVDKASSSNVKNCEIYNCYRGEYFTGVGIALFKESTGTYNNCIIHDIKGKGIEIQEASSPTIENCKMNDIQEIGIQASGNASPTVENCEIYDCLMHGILCNSDSTGIYRKCKIHNVNGNGIDAIGNKKIKIIDCEIYDLRND